MKNPFRLRLPCLIFFLSFHLLTHAQGRFGIEFGMGLAVPTSKDINKAFYAGGDVSLGFKAAVLPSKRLWIMPCGGTKIYVKNAGSDNSVTETFRTWKAGVELQYKTAEHKKYAFFPLLRVDQNWCSNFFSKTYDYNAATNTQTIAQSDNYLSGNGLSFDAGIMIVRSSLWFLKIDYEYFKPSLNVNNDLKNELLAEGFAIPAATKLNCSSLNIGVGVNFNFKK